MIPGQECSHDFIPTFPDSGQYFCTKCNLGGVAQIYMSPETLVRSVNYAS